MQMPLKRLTIKVIVIIGLVFLAAYIAGLINAWLDSDGPTQNVNTTVIAPASPLLKRTAKVNIVIKKPVKVYAGGKKTKKKLKLPEKVVKDKNKQVIAGIKVLPKDDHPRSINTVLDLETGESTTYITKEPLPWFIFDTRGSAGIYAGIKNGKQAIRLQAKQNLIRIKRIRIAAITSIDQQLNQANTSQDYFIGVGAEYSW